MCHLIGNSTGYNFGAIVSACKSSALELGSLMFKSWTDKKAFWKISNTVCLRI